MSDPSSIQVRALLARQQLLNQKHYKRLARKIHDEVSQKMTLLALQLSLASTKGDEPADWAKDCKDWADLVMQLGQSIRNITVELQPRVIDESGLAAALRWFAQFSSKDIYCEIAERNGPVAVPEFAGNELFAICREIVTDFFIPAKVAKVKIELEQQDGIIRFHIRPDSSGTGKQALTEGIVEAVAVHERLQCLDGSAELTPLANSEPTLTMSVPASRGITLN